MYRFVTILATLAMMLSISFAASDLFFMGSVGMAKVGELSDAACPLFPGQDELPVLSADDDNDRTSSLLIDFQKQLFHPDENKPGMAFIVDQFRAGSRGSPAHIKDLIILKLRI